MKVVDPNNTNHSLKVIPRFYTINAVDILLFNESDKVETTVQGVYNIVNGIMTYSFDFTFNENDKYQFTLLNVDDVFYRGKITATSQVPQDYKLTNGLYAYE